MPSAIIRLVLLVVLAALLVSPITARSLPKHAASRVRRQLGDIHMGAHRAQLNLQQQLNPQGCRQVGCGLDFGVRSRSRRATSDQRMAELQALIALSNGGGDMVGHGAIDPFSAGKKKRSEDYVDMEEAPFPRSQLHAPRSQLIEKLLAALQHKQLL